MDWLESEPSWRFPLSSDWIPVDFFSGGFSIVGLYKHSQPSQALPEGYLSNVIVKQVDAGGEGVSQSFDESEEQVGITKLRLIPG